MNKVACTNNIQQDEKMNDINLKTAEEKEKPNLSADTEKGIGGRIIEGYSRFLVKFPWIVVIVVIVVVAIFGGIAFKFSKLPDFGQPTKGFEARGTYIKGSEFAHTHVVNNLTSSASGRRKRSLPVTYGYSGENILTHMKSRNQERRVKRSTGSSSSSSFCQFNPSDSLVTFAFEGTDNSHKNLFTKEAMQGMCRFENEIIKTIPQFSTCLGISLGNVVALLAGNETCMQLSDTDVSNVLNLLKTCASSYHGKTLDTNPLCNQTVVDTAYGSYNAIHLIFHYLTDSNFLPKGQLNSDTVQYSLMVYLYFNDVLEFYQNKIENLNFKDTYVKLVAVGADIKFDLFSEYMIGDVVYFAIAFILILLSMVLYLRSFVVTIATVFDILFSFVVAYFLYHIVFRFTFFPFMNVLTALILIAVGADDVFVFMDIWLLEAKNNPDRDLVYRLDRTLRHASLSVFVTSATTCTAFLANMVGNITSIKCFGMFSALAIISNFILMVTWVPAIIILLEKIYLCCCKNKTCCSCYNKLEKICHTISTTIFDKFFPLIISKFWFGWIAIWLLLGIGGLVVIFGTPTLKLPSSNDFQFFASDHLLEVYDLQIKRKFPFVTEQAGSQYMYAQYVFGVENVDNGNHYDPDNKGSLVLDKQFNYGTEYISFLTSFCNDLSNAGFVANDTKSNLNALTCNVSSLINSGYLSAYYSGSAMKAAIMAVQTNKVWTASYNEMSSYKDEITDFIDARIKNAPAGLQTGFVYSDLDFYDLQKGLSSGTFSGIAVSLSCACIVMFLTTFNVLITLFAIVTITISISITIGILVLLGWELNILESVTISLAVGMSIDFTIHYGVAYQLSKKLSRKDRTREAFTNVGSAVAMAAFTTFIAGLCVIGSRVLSYSQLGTFLMIVMAASWACSTLFFQSLCYKFGPEGKCAQVPCCCCCCKKCKVSDRIEEQDNAKDIEKNTTSINDGTVYSISEKKGIPNPAMEYDESSGINIEKTTRVVDAGPTSVHS